MGKAFQKIPFPAVRRFGEKAISREGLVKAKLKGPENMRVAINSAWKLGAAKKKFGNKRTLKPLLHHASGRVH